MPLPGASVDAREERQTACGRREAQITRPERHPRILFPQAQNDGYIP